MSDNILSFPASAPSYRNKTRLSDFLRTIADHIDNMELQTDPHALMLVLTGDKWHEVLHVGYNLHVDVLEAAMAAHQYGITPVESGSNFVTRTRGNQ